ncbi:hypothetical protein HGRIS_001871 [Hohenbuehelia grisea]|uniref:Uncharacterized protein n=1 Tax=Hohenbuehelia grisea TaxID=104357 RepID=A0ABR3JIP6_9AGAR
MRAAISLYEHPDMSSDDEKMDGKTKTVLVAAVGALTIAVASTLAVYRYPELVKFKDGASKRR